MEKPAMTIQPEDLNRYLEVALEAAREGGSILKMYWGKLEEIGEKSNAGDLVTVADLESEKTIIASIRKHFPDHPILAEESGLNSQEYNKYLWVIDPLDGTTNYTHQYPMVSISIALLYDSQPIVGIVYNPILHELFQGALGMGTTLNGRKLQVSNISSLDKSLLCTGFAYNRTETDDNNYKEFFHLTQISQGVRRVGSAALDLAYVAAGRLDGFWELGLKPWDVAAGTLLVNEAGGNVTSFDGTPLILQSGRILATNGRIHQAMINELQKAKERT